MSKTRDDVKATTSTDGLRVERHFTQPETDPFDTVTWELREARIGSGEVALGGRIGLDGFGLTDYSLTARGRSMRLRYPTGFNSTVDMDLALTGPIDAPRLAGTVDVLRVAYLGEADPSTSIFGLASGSPASTTPLTSVPAAIAAEGTSIALDIQVTAPRMPVIDCAVGDSSARSR